MAKRKVSPRPKKDRIFGDLRRKKLLRHRIPVAEAAAGFACFVAVVLMIAWVVAQRDAFDPGERDLSMEVLLASATPEDLYHTPLQRWRDPAQGSSGVAVVEDLGPFPPSILSGGWRSASRVQTFVPDTLYEKINGQAEQYVKFGFRQLDFVSLEQPDLEVSLDLYLYDQDVFANALGLYAEQRGSKPVEQRGPVLFTPTSLGATGLLGKHVFHVIGSEASDAVRAKANEVIDALARQAAEVRLPEPFVVLRERLELPIDGIAYTPVNAFQLGFAQRFWFGRADPREPASLFVHWADSGSAARTLRDRLRDAQQEELEVLEAREEYALVRHRFLQTYGALAVEGAVLFGVDDQPDRERALATLASVRAAVTGSRAPLPGPAGGSHVSDGGPMGDVPLDAGEPSYDEYGEGMEEGS